MLGDKGVFMCDLLIMVGLIGRGMFIWEFIIRGKKILI